MSDLRSAAEAALAYTLEGPFGVGITFTNPDTTATQTVRGQVTRVDTMVDPQTGARVYAPHTAVTVRIASLDGIPDEGWPIETTDITGATVSGVCRSPEYDYTLGTVTYHVEVVDAD